MLTIEVNPITKIRLAHGIPMYKLAKMAGLSAGRVSQIEKGIDSKRGLPPRLLQAVEQLGYDAREVQAEYLAWKEWLARRQEKSLVGIAKD